MNPEDLIRLIGQGLSQVALREAQGDLMELINRVRAALQARYVLAGRRETWVDMVALYADRVIVREDNNGLVAYPLSVTADGGINLGDPAKVTVQYDSGSGKPDAAPACADGDCGGGFVEASGEQPGRRFEIRIIRAGLSGNANYYPDTVLREAAPLFEGARVFVKSDAEHIKGLGKDVRNLIGRISGVTFVEGKSADTGELQGTFDVLQSAGDIAARLAEAKARDMADIFGFSVDAVGTARPGVVDGQQVRVATKISRVKSVDLIVEPGAGGELIRLVEAQQENETMWRDRLITMIRGRRPDLLNGVDVSKLTDADIEAKFREAFPDGEGDGNGGTAITIQAPDPVAISRQVDALVDARVYLREAVALSRLPKAAQERVVALVEAKGSFSRDDVDAAVKAEREYVARFVESGRVSELGGTARIEAGESRAEKVAQMLDAFFDPAHRDHRHAQSFREAYADITGDRQVTGRMDRCDVVRMTEALDSTSFSLALGDAITRRLLNLYRSQTPLDLWRRIAQVGRAADFREQHRVSWGGYGDLPVVAEKGTYDPLASPDDEEAKYKVSKRGGTENLTLELIKNDDVGMIREIPNKLQRAAKRTLSRFAFNFILGNPVIYDGKALFHADHGNLAATALDADTYDAGRVAMLNQTEPGSAEPLFIGPRLLLVSATMERASYDLFIRNLNNDPNFVATLKPDIIPVWCQTDANDWTMMADPSEMPTVEIGFLDGQEEPELFVQDNPSVGSLFTNDTITYKIRHIYGGTVVNYRGARRNIVP